MTRRRVESRRAELRRLRESLPADAPRHVHHCHALGSRDWWIWTWRKGAAATKTRVPYRCRSWRCPICRVHESHVAWTRMQQAFDPLDPTGACLLVLTLDRLGTYSGERRWENAKEAYQDLSALTQEFMRGLRRWMKSMGWTPLQNQWVSTVEMHRNGWPHMNFVIWSPELAAWLEEEKRAKMADGISERDTRFVSRELADVVTGAGFGIISTAERARSREESLGYITKLAKKVDESFGELAKLTQLPTAAPPRFRRIRSGKGFLPPRRKNAEVTGTLVRRQYSALGYDVIPLHEIKQPELIRECEQCCAIEEKVWFDELEAQHRCARQFKQWGQSAIELPPVTRWLGKTRLAQPPPEMKTRHANRESVLFEPAQLVAATAAA